MKKLCLFLLIFLSGKNFLAFFQKRQTFLFVAASYRCKREDVHAEEKKNS